VGKMGVELGIVYHEDYLTHDPRISNPWSPEIPERLIAINRLFKLQGIYNHPSVLLYEPTLATEEDLLRVHSKEYIERFRSLGKKGGFIAPETPVLPETFYVASLAAGGVIQAGQLVLRDEIKKAYALIRPPGHHADVSTAGGFCYFNDVAIMVRKLQKFYGLKKILIVDFDAHHGNGIQNIFYSDPRVLYISLHEYGYHPSGLRVFPGTGWINEIGEGPGKGYKINMPLPGGTTDRSYLYAMNVIVPPIAEEYRPELLIAYCGADAHFKESETAELCLSLKSYKHIADMLVKISNKFCGGKMVTVLGGGYDLDALAKVNLIMINSMLNIRGNRFLEKENPPPEKSAISYEVRKRLSNLKNILSPYWKAMSG
jgi:acetoin utilization deacetylase AcuC-like enzyme